MKKSKVILFGDGEIAELVHFYLKADSNLRVVAFTVDGELQTKTSYLKLPVIPFEELPKIFPSEEYSMFIALSYQKMNKRRAEKYALAKSKGYNLVNFIHSKAQVASNVKFGDNCFVFENNVIQPFVQIGNDVILWSGNHIGHHSVIKDHCFIASHVVVSGGVTIEPFCFVGVNATFRDHIHVAAECIIGAGATIMSDTDPKSVYVAPKASKLEIASDQINKI